MLNARDCWSNGLLDTVEPAMTFMRLTARHSTCFDVAMIVHGVRSLRDEETMLGVLSEMMRVASRIFLTESLPIARTRSQAAHLEMYNLREEIFEAVLGSKDDIHYIDLDTLKSVVEEAGGGITRSEVLEVNLPHYLAVIPRDYVERFRTLSKERIFFPAGTLPTSGS